MMPSPAADRSRTSLSPDLDGHIVRFEKAWHFGKPPRLADFLPDDHSDAARISVLKELIKIDLEFRWRSAAKTLANQRVLEEYFALHPELQQLSKIPVDLILEEYRVRQRWGDRPSHADYAQRFP